MKVIETSGNGMKVITDKVELASCYLAGSYEYDKEFGSINASIAIDKDEYEKSELKKVLDATLQYSYDQAVKKNPKFKSQIQKVEKVIDEVDDNGDETGRILIKLKNKCKYEKDGELHDRVLNVVDSKNNKILDYANLTSGTVARVSFTILPYYISASKSAGISCWLNAIQVIEPKWYEGNSEFDEVSEGFVVVDKVKHEIMNTSDSEIMKSLDEL